MQIFALETDIGRLKQRFLSAEEVEVRIVHYHWFPFLLSCIRNALIAAVIVAIVLSAGWVGVPLLWASVPGLATLFVFAFLPLLRAYIDWRYDCIIITSDKLIIIDQSSVFRQKVTPINLESFSNASAETQYLNLFSFGKINIGLKEGSEQMLTLRYIPDAHGVASALSDALTLFQRRKDLRRYGEPSEEAHRGSTDSNQ